LRKTKVALTAFVFLLLTAQQPANKPGFMSIFGVDSVGFDVICRRKSPVFRPVRLAKSSALAEAHSSTASKQVTLTLETVKRRAAIVEVRALWKQSWVTLCLNLLGEAQGA
jgi:hypothetical protein